MRLIGYFLFVFVVTLIIPYRVSANWPVARYKNGTVGLSNHGGVIRVQSNDMVVDGNLSVSGTMFIQNRDVAGYEDRVSVLESVLGTSGKINPNFLTDATFHNAISECLKEAPIDGLCLNYGLSSGYGVISSWNTSQVTDMSGEVCVDENGNGDFDYWNDCSFVGFANTEFNGNIKSWDVSHVTTMKSMFMNAWRFNQPIGNWNVSQVTSMHEMFEDASAFNQLIGKWDVSKVNNMEDMFEDSHSFNQPIGDWDVSQVTNMHEMFEDAYSFNQFIGEWDISRVTNMEAMFREARAFNQPIDIGSSCSSCVSWDVLHVTTMRDMFRGATSFNQPIVDWNVSQVVDMEGMFEDASAFNQPIANWDVSHVTTMEDMFQRAYSFNRPIGNWNTSQVTDMNHMFNDASAFAQDISSWKGTAANSMQTNMFDGATAFQTKYSCSDALHGPASSCVSKSGPPKCIPPRGDKLQFNGMNWICVCVSGWAGVTCEALQESIPDATFHSALANCLAEAPSDGLCMTYGFITTKYGLMPDWNVSQVKDMSGYDLNTHKMKGFGQSSSFNGNISRWDVSQVTNMNCLFYTAYSFNQDISRWSTSRVTDLGDIFAGSKFDVDINAWDVSSVTNMWGAFRGMDFNRNISSWDTSKVENMGSMFKKNRMFNHYIGDWNTASLTNFQNIFEEAVAFQAKYTCANANSYSVNPSSCTTTHSTWTAPPPPLPQVSLESIISELQTKVENSKPLKCWPPGGDKLQFDGTKWICTCVNRWSGETCEILNAILNVGFHTCVLLDNDSVKCWGYNSYGQLGLGDTKNRGDGANEMGNNLPSVDLGGRTAKAISAGRYHTCALLDDDSAKCWGYNKFGQLGLGDTNNRGDGANEMGDNLPAVSLGTGRTAKAISVGSIHTCALLDDGFVKCWGDNGYAQLGLGDTNDRGDGVDEMGDNLPAVSLGTGRTAKAISVSVWYHTCALLDDGSVKCWGRNDDEQLGLGDTSTRGDGANEMGDNLPAVSLGTGRTAKAISAGGSFSCALLDNGFIKCWGHNSYGQLGLGDRSNRGGSANEMGDNLPAVSLGTGRTVKSISSGAYHTCALLDDGSVKCWGRNNEGQLGLGDTFNRGDGANEMGDNLPSVDLGTGRTAKAIFCGLYHTFALLDDNSIKCWGKNNYGQLGLGDTNNRGDGQNEMGDNLPAVLNLRA